MRNCVLICLVIKGNLSRCGLVNENNSWNNSLNTIPALRHIFYNAINKRGTGNKNNPFVLTINQRSDRLPDDFAN